MAIFTVCLNVTLNGNMSSMYETEINFLKQDFSNTFQGYVHIFEVYIVLKTIPQKVDLVTCIG